MIAFQFNDGGRAAAGFRGFTSDCVVRAIAIATEQPYQAVYDAVNELAKLERPGKRQRGRSSARTGVYRTTYDLYLKNLGWVWVPTMTFGSGCKVHLTRDELPGGRLIVRVSRHVAAVVNGVLLDTHDCSRGGTRCVYGYYHRPSKI